MNVLNIKNLMDNLYDDIVEAKQILIDLDSEMGDGDLGITMEKIFKVTEEISNENVSDIGNYFVKLGFAMMDAAPSTMGTIMSSGFLNVGKGMKGIVDMQCSDWMIFFESFYQGVKKRTNAVVGEKTIIDILDPVCQEITKNNFDDEKMLFSILLKTAKNSLEKTKTMIAQHGRGAYYKEKSLGHQDAGATVIFLLIKSFEKSIAKLSL